MLSCFSHVWLFASLWTTDCQALLSRGLSYTMGLSRQEYRSGLSCSPTREVFTIQRIGWELSKSLQFRGSKKLVLTLQIFPPANLIFRKEKVNLAGRDSED